MPDASSQRPILDVFYRRFLKTEHSADFVQSVAEQYSLASLETLGRMGDRMTRRAAILAVGFIGSFAENRLMGGALVDPDRGVRLLADHGIRQLWFRVGNPGVEFGLRQLVRLNRQHRFASAIDQAYDLIEIKPKTAEAWNQRAIAFYNMEDYDQALYDCQRTLELNPCHFLAALGSANCHLELGNVIEALDDFRVALNINPDLETVRNQINQLQRIVEGR